MNHIYFLSRLRNLKETEIEDNAMDSISGGALIARMLQAEGVEVVFGIIDGSYFGLYASLRDVGIRLVTPRHETSAVHMAGAYARLTGKRCGGER